MTIRVGTLAVVFAAITACDSGGHDGDRSANSTSIVTVSPSPSCMESAVIKRPSHKVRAELSCRLTVGEGATITFMPSEEPGCRPYVVGVAPNDFNVRSIRIATSNGDDKIYQHTIGFDQFGKVLPDRKSNFMFYGGPSLKFPSEACSEIPLNIEGVLCSGSQLGEFETCGDNVKIELIEPDFYKSYSADF